MCLLFDKLCQITCQIIEISSLGISFYLMSCLFVAALLQLFYKITHKCCSFLAARVISDKFTDSLTVCNHSQLILCLDYKTGTTEKETLDRMEAPSVELSEKLFLISCVKLTFVTFLYQNIITINSNRMKGQLPNPFNNIRRRESIAETRALSLQSHFCC